MAKRAVEVQFMVEGYSTPTRLDKVLKAQYPRWGRQAVGKLISSRQVKINQQQVWLSSWKVKNGDLIIIYDPPPDKPQGLTKFDPAWIVSEEQDLIVVNKPAGLRSQATRAGGRDNLLSLAQAQYGEVHLFHRLDRDTSGLCLLTLSGPVNAYLDNAFQQRLVEKEYLAVVADLGKLKDEGVITAGMLPDPKRRDKMRAAPLGEDLRGVKSAETRYRVEGEAAAGRLVRLWAITGRTHQLRVHLAYLGAPIVGDRLYGGQTNERLMLHAARLALPQAGDFPEREYSVEVDWPKPTGI